MKAWFWIALAAALLAPPLAQARDGRFGRPWLEVQGPRMQHGVPERAERGERDARREFRGRRGREDRGHDRLTEDERRELHRDLDRARHEIYRRKPPR
jgi:hypothetical protein